MFMTTLDAEWCGYLDGMDRGSERSERNQRMAMAKLGISAYSAYSRGRVLAAKDALVGREQDYGHCRDLVFETLNRWYKARFPTIKTRASAYNIAEALRYAHDELMDWQATEIEPHVLAWLRQQDEASL